MKDFFLKKMIKSQAKDVSDEDVDKMLEVFNKNPELFKKIAEEIKMKTDSGKDQMSATFEVMKKYEEELKTLKPNK